MRLDTLAKVAALVLLGSLVPAHAGEEKVAVGKLPKAVKAAVKEKFPKAEIKGAAKEEAGGKTLYEVSLTQKGKTIDLSIKPDGTIAEIEVEIEAEDVPKPVLAAFKKKYPKAKIEKIEELIVGGVTSYEMVIVVGKKKPFEVVATLDVKIEKAKAEADEEKDDEKDAKAKKGEKEDENGDDEREAKSKKGDEDGDDDEKMKGKKGEKEDKDGDEKEVKGKKGEKEDKDDDEDDDDDEKETKVKKGEKKQDKGDMDDEDDDNV